MEGPYQVFIDDEGNQYRIPDIELMLIPQPHVVDEEAILTEARGIQMRRRSRVLP